ncbi:MAG: universal stress protein, partial [Gemmataceae bacterium]
LIRRMAAEGMDMTFTPARRYRSILVPVDGSQFAEHALPLALGIARRSGAIVRVVHVRLLPRPAVRPEPLYYEDSRLSALLKRRQQEYLEDLCRRISRTTSVPVTSVPVQGGEVAHALAAASTGADLVVMATHGRGKLGRLVWGSVAYELMRKLSVPLLLVRGYNAPADLTGDPIIRKVLVPLDGTTAAEKSLGPALAFGNAMRAEHTLLRALPWDADLAHGGRQVSETWSYYEAVVKRLGARGVQVNPCIVLDERPTAEAILRYARVNEFDAVALVIRERSGLSRLFRSGVADQLIQGASVPVLVIRENTEIDKVTGRKDS